MWTVLRQKVIAGVPVFNIDFVTHFAEFINVFEKNNFHIDTLP